LSALTSLALLSQELRRHVEAAGPLVRERVFLPGTSDTFEIARPVDFDHLIDEAAADPEQNLPYWAELWPSGVALAAAIARAPEALRGKRVLEIGCGLGITATAALRAGADLLVTDYAPEALALCALNALDQSGRSPETLRMNWRDPGPALRTLVRERFPVVLAADVLYESRDVEPLLTLVECVVAPFGELWLAEPGRAPAGRFLESIKTQDWAVDSDRCAGPWPDPEDNRKGVIVSIHRLRRQASPHLSAPAPVEDRSRERDDW
jgi:predicted nicotinamide N-methyase